MAGGTFDKLAGKVRPGTYVNFESTRNDYTGVSERGTTVIPLINHTYGPEKEMLLLTNGSPDAQRDKLGYSIYDSDPAGNMLLIREAFKNARYVYVYIPKIGAKAAGTGGGVSATARYGGTRGNDLKYSIVANPLNGFDVSVYLGEDRVALYEGLSTAAELIAQENEYIAFTGSAELTAIAGVSLTGGENAEASNMDMTEFLDALDNIKFNTLCFPVTESTLHTAVRTKITYMRNNVGKGVQAVVPDYAGDFEGLINVTNSAVVDGVEMTHAQACAWVAGASAGASYVQSLTYRKYVGATSIVDPKNNEESIAAIRAGEFFFSYSESGEVIVEYDINSLTTFVKPKDKTYSKNRVIRVFDTFQESLQLNFPPNKYDNSPTGWDVMEGLGKAILKRFEDVGAIKNVDYDNDFLVDRELSTGDEVFFNVGLEPVDSAEKLYFTVKTR